MKPVFRFLPVFMNDNLNETSRRVQIPETTPALPPEGGQRNAKKTTGSCQRSTPRRINHNLTSHAPRPAPTRNQRHRFSRAEPA
jgi:hypothetical protein